MLILAAVLTYESFFVNTSYLGTSENQLNNFVAKLVAGLEVLGHRAV